jgi:hypothetical protein
VHLREPRQHVPRFAGGEHERDPVRQKTASDERKCSSRRPIEPLRVVDQAEEGLFLSRFRHEAEDRQSDQERIRGSAGAQSEGDRKGLALRIGQALRELEDRGAQLLERRERKLHLSFDPTGPHDLEVRPRLDRVLQQGGLADARVAVDHQDPTASTARDLQQPLERLALALPAEQSHSRRPLDPG